MDVFHEKRRTIIFGRIGNNIRGQISFSTSDLEEVGITEDDRIVDVIMTDKYILISPAKNRMTKYEIEKLQREIEPKKWVKLAIVTCDKIIKELNNLRNTLKEYSDK